MVATSSAFFTALDWIEWDPFFVLALMVYTFAESPTVVFATAALGVWIDERFLLILPALTLLRLARGDKSVMPTVLGVALYLILRLVSTALGDPSVADQIAMQRKLSFWFPVGYWEGFRLGWLLVFFGMGVALTQRRLLFWGAWLGGLGLITWLAWDTSRSIAVMTPFLIQGVIATWRRRRTAAVVTALAVGDFFLPAGHVVAQVYFPLHAIWAPARHAGVDMNQAISGYFARAARRQGQDLFVVPHAAPTRNAAPPGKNDENGRQRAK